LTCQTLLCIDQWIVKSPVLTIGVVAVTIFCAATADAADPDLGKTIAGIRFTQTCYAGVAYGKRQQFTFSVQNQRHAVLRNVHIDFYFGGGARVVDNLRYDNAPTAVMKVSGGHAWTTLRTIPAVRGSNSAFISSGLSWGPIVLVPKSASKPWKIRMDAVVNGTAYSYRPECGPPIP
jgi:hypothetical protein